VNIGQVALVTVPWSCFTGRTGKVAEVLPTGVGLTFDTDPTIYAFGHDEVERIAA
jgi:hypothetical protein